MLTPLSLNSGVPMGSEIAMGAFIVLMLIFGPSIRRSIEAFFARKQAKLEAWIEQDRKRRGLSGD